MITLPLFCVLILQVSISSFFQQEKFTIFKNSDFEIQYLITTHENERLMCKGKILERKSRKPVRNINIWVDCKNADNTTSGTVPNEEGEFELEFPDKCKEVRFLKYGYNPFSIFVKKVSVE